MRLNALGIVCGDVEASLAFYRMLGVPFGAYDPQEGHYSADLGNGFRLMLDTHDIARAFIEGFRPPRGNDQMTLAVEYGTPAEVDAAYAEVLAAGHT
jgi:catechol 2,3-dioxygenase-like lactoylglutathione lyase family enzyme